MLRILLDELAFYWVADFSVLKKSRHKNEWCLRKLRIFIGTIQWSSWETCWIWLWVPCYQGLKDPVTASSDYKFFFGGGGGGGRSCLAVCSTKTQTPNPFNSSSVYWFYQPRCQLSVVYFITFSCEGDDVNKILTRIPSRGRLDLERNTLIFLLGNRV